MLPTSTSYQLVESADPARIISSGFNGWIAQGIWLSTIENQKSPQPASINYNLSKVISLEPGNRFYRTNAAGILAYDLTAGNLHPDTRQQLLNNSIKVLEEGITRCPKDAPFYHYELGKIYLLKKKNPEQARAHFRLASTEDRG